MHVEESGGLGLRHRDRLETAEVQDLSGRQEISRQRPEPVLPVARRDSPRATDVQQGRMALPRNGDTDSDQQAR